jgi:hypothetical protein
MSVVDSFCKIEKILLFILLGIKTFVPVL